MLVLKVFDISSRIVLEQSRCILHSYVLTLHMSTDVCSISFLTQRRISVLLTWLEQKDNHKRTSCLVHYCPNELIDSLPDNRCTQTLSKGRGRKSDLRCIDIVDTKSKTHQMPNSVVKVMLVLEVWRRAYLWKQITSPPSLLKQ